MSNRSTRTAAGLLALMALVALTVPAGASPHLVTVDDPENWSALPFATALSVGDGAAGTPEGSMTGSLGPVGQAQTTWGNGVQRPFTFTLDGDTATFRLDGPDPITLGGQVLSGSPVVNAILLELTARNGAVVTLSDLSVIGQDLGSASVGPGAETALWGLGGLNYALNLPVTGMLSMTWTTPPAANDISVRFVAAQRDGGIITDVPEPAPLAVLAGGLLALATLRQRRLKTTGTTSSRVRPGS